MEKIVDLKRSGILMHISSLPSPYGIGTLGKAAYAFVDFLKVCGTEVWQVLPVGPTGYGDSPYQSFSMYAGNPYFIDLDLLVHDGMLHAQDLDGIARYTDAISIDYEYLYKTRWKVLRQAYCLAYKDVAEDVAAFSKKNEWLSDYALFCALKNSFSGLPWSDWPDHAVRMREPAALTRYRHALCEEIHFYMFVQYLFYKQWFALKRYANDNGIIIFGDMPVYVAMDSADTWTAPEAFQLDQDRRPIHVAGVPPDYFSKDGQLWGNPLYDWGWHKRQNYDWWTKRLRAMLTLFDMVRIDHFIGFVHYYAVPSGAQNARDGAWCDGPGKDLFRVLRQTLPDMLIIAEDLGVVTPQVRQLREEYGFPGMKVLLFGFGSDENNPHLPQNIKPDTVVYSGTHDNDTIVGWWQTAGEAERQCARATLRIREDDHICRAIIKAAYGSPAKMAIIPMQDFLKLGSEARMNKPGTVSGNWKWRVLSSQISESLADDIRMLNKEYDRISFSAYGKK